MKQTMYLEHANITVRDLEKAIHFFQTAFPDFKVRGGGTQNNRKWVHLGNETTYVALNRSLTDAEKYHEIDYVKNGFNHLGFVVDDVSMIAERLLAAGYKRDYPRQVEQYRIRDYFIDNDGNEYEFVQYLSDNTDERNSYDV